MQICYLKFLALSIFCSVVIGIAYAKKSYNAQQRAEEIAYKFVWPDRQVPNINVTFSDKANVACCVWHPAKPHSLEIRLEKEEFNSYNNKAKDFILAHEIAHYYLSKIGYLPELIVHNRVLQYVLYFLSTVKNVFGFLLGFGIKCSILIPRLFLQRLIEYEADKQAALILKDKTSVFDRFKPITPSHKKTAFMKLTEIIGLWFSTHPYDVQRKQALKELVL